MPSQNSSAPADPGRGFVRLLDLLSDTLQHRRGPVFEVVFAVAAIAVATVGRFVLDDLLPPGFPFLTFFPAVLLTLVFASVRAGLGVAVICGLASWVWFIPQTGPGGVFSGRVLAIGFYALIVGTQILFVAASERALDALRAARKQSADHARARDLMFSELQHRVSNNLATVAALLRMQGSQTIDPQTKLALKQAQLRIGAISRLQRRLHSPDRQSVEAGDFLRSLASDTVGAAGSGCAVDVSVQADQMDVTNDQAVPLGLIAGELMMNAIEHGCEDRQKVRISLTLKRDEDMAHLTVHDDGPGLPEGFDLEQSQSLGLVIARQLATQLGGELAMESPTQGGTLARLSFSA